LGGTPNNAKESSMSDHHARIEWQRKSTDFTYATYNREHEWQFTAARVPASAAKEYRGDANCVNPEEALVASLSSCHMLVFLAIAAKRKLSLDVYTDDAVGVLGKNSDGKLAITRVTLRPKVVWSAGVTVSPEDLAKMHHDAHEGCFIANSVKTEVTVAAPG
jgi:organic hydroperoxide reductase OsmC/OhrA